MTARHPLSAIAPRGAPTASDLLDELRHYDVIPLEVYEAIHDASGDTYQRGRTHELRGTRADVTVLTGEDAHPANVARLLRSIADAIEREAWRGPASAWPDIDGRESPFGGAPDDDLPPAA